VPESGIDEVVRIHEPEATTFTPLEFDLRPHLQLVLQLELAGVERSSIVDPVVILGTDHTGLEGPGPVDPDETPLPRIPY